MGIGGFDVVPCKSSCMVRTVDFAAKSRGCVGIDDAGFCGDKIFEEDWIDGAVGLRGMLDGDRTGGAEGLGGVIGVAGEIGGDRGGRAGMGGVKGRGGGGGGEAGRGSIAVGEGVTEERFVLLTRRDGGGVGATGGIALGKGVVGTIGRVSGGTETPCGDEGGNCLTSTGDDGCVGSAILARAW